MPYPNLAIAVVMQRTQLDNRWQSEKWEPIGVLTDSSGPGSAVRVLRQDGVSAQWLHPGFKLELFHDESEGYYLNLYSPRPYVFVNWLEEDGKGVPQSVTVSYNEAARFLDAGEQVDAVPMPGALLAAMESFVAKHYQPEPRKKAKRNELYEGEERLRDASVDRPPR